MRNYPFVREHFSSSKNNRYDILNTITDTQNTLLRSTTAEFYLRSIPDSLQRTAAEAVSPLGRLMFPMPSNALKHCELSCAAAEACTLFSAFGAVRRLFLKRNAFGGSPAWTRCAARTWGERRPGQVIGLCRGNAAIARKSGG
jgi:hypothetical protein